ncbi:hypothetical protein BO70DRAFT_427848 [Aspergillus heteromorphus CBS 117.55]|uniref:FAR-17a/AIG1-like protein n=1 Tax=Aspergillus heteromorphus CBS 117.55 TaxID=1448321 RepID=A0A317WNK3_9EURO|nr:uncharacterized protein BO70DRAFT_427848 [Aspergillus heteromorphus CBS 117.55]PWY86852.1 hypothetical protein BO70DRAFT_427848 [Aspergillus heteromorphus CBS 117.55]
MNKGKSLSLYHLLHVDPSLDRDHVYETSWLLPPLAYAILRGAISLYIFTSIFFIWGWYGTHGDRDEIGQSFSYFTWLTYWGIGFYMLFASIHTACYALKGRSVLFDRWPRALRALHGLFYTTITTYPFLVTIVYWGILFSGPWFTVTMSAWQNISQHGLNSLYALLEITLATTNPHPLLSLAVLIFLLLLYVALAYLTYHTEGFYTYSFLDVGPHGEHSAKVTGYCFAILAIILVFFVFSWCLIWLRRRLTRGMVKRSAYDPDRSAADVEVVEVEVARS